MISRSVLARVREEAGPIRSFASVGGGSISRTYKLERPKGLLFLKVQSSAPTDFFKVERSGLGRLASAGAPLRIPQVIGVGEAGGEAYILMEWLQEKTTGGNDEQLGAGLANLHRTQAELFGWEGDGYIGSLPQQNGQRESWSEFWHEQRLEPQLRRLQLTVANQAGWRELERLLPELLAAGDEEGPSLLHGDLWSGNVISTELGPALVDPACYHGHREVDLAMAELFGGFRSSFFRAYADAWPLQPGYEARKGVYQLYYLLVHVNLFGASYVPRTEDTLRRILSPA